MKIAIGCDDAAVALLNVIAETLKADYPDIECGQNCFHVISVPQEINTPGNAQLCC